MSRLVAVTGLLAAVAFGGLAPGTASAQRAGLPGHCPDANGVTVVVDFQELGGSTIVRCAPGDQATGLAALKNAGIQIKGTNRWGEGFVCRIEGKPGSDTEACIDTPPAKAYWSYWHAPDGGSWKYSDKGVLNRKPALGSFEGWSFSKDKTETTNPPPRVAPVRPAAPPPQQPNPPAPQPGNPTPGNPGSGSPGQGTRPPGNGATPAPTNGQPPVTTTPAPTSGEVPTTPSVPESGASSVSGSAPPTSGSAAGGGTWTGDIVSTSENTDQDSPIGLILGAALILVLAGVTIGVTVRRKRAAAHGDQ